MLICFAAKSLFYAAAKLAVLEGGKNTFVDLLAFAAASSSSLLCV